MTEHDGRNERDMNLKSGEPYFINEVDVLTGSKIGGSGVGES